MHRSDLFCACAESHPGDCCPLIHSRSSNDSVGEQKALVRLHGCEDKGLRCPHISEDTFSHGKNFIITIEVKLREHGAAKCSDSYQTAHTMRRGLIRIYMLRTETMDRIKDKLPVTKIICCFVICL